MLKQYRLSPRILITPHIKSFYQVLQSSQLIIFLNPRNSCYFVFRLPTNVTPGSYCTIVLPRLLVRRLFCFRILFLCMPHHSPSTSSEAMYCLKNACTSLAFSCCNLLCDLSVVRRGLQSYTIMYLPCNNNTLLCNYIPKIKCNFSFVMWPIL